MKFIKYTLLSFVILTLNACQDFTELEKNNNKQNQVPKELVLKGNIKYKYYSKMSL